MCDDNEKKPWKKNRKSFVGNLNVTSRRELRN